jgi:hypothetical protein
LNKLSIFINVLIWFFANILLFRYGISLAFDKDPGIAGSLLSVTFIHMMIGLNGAATKRSQS